MSENTPNTKKAVIDPSLLAKANGPANSFVPFWTVFKAAADEANAAQKTYREATKSSDDAVQAVLNESEDAKVTEWRTFNEKIQAKIDELTSKRDEAKSSMTKYAKSLVSTISEDEATALKTAYIEARAAANLTSKNILALLRGDQDAFKAGIESYGVVEVIGISRNATSTGASDIVRKRLSSATVNGQPFADGKGKVSFTNLAAHLKVGGAELRDAAAKAANVDSVRDIPAGTTVSFDIVSDGKTHKVTISTPDNDKDETQVTTKVETESDSE